MSEHETIADIIAEMRALSNPISDGIIAIDGRSIADRLEAAHKRELDALNEQITDLRQQRDLWSKRAAELVEKCNEQYAKLKQVGNAAKLREALEHIKDRLPHMLQYMRVHWEDASAGGYFDELMLVTDAALSAPPRNCDLSKVVEDPWRAWLDDESNWEDGNPKLEIHDWLLAPATEKEGGDDGNK